MTSGYGPLAKIRKALGSVQRQLAGDVAIGAFMNSCQVFPMAIDGMKIHVVTDMCESRMNEKLRRRSFAAQGHRSAITSGMPGAEAQNAGPASIARRNLPPTVIVIFHPHQWSWTPSSLWRLLSLDGQSVPFITFLSSRSLSDTSRATTSTQTPSEARLAGRLTIAILPTVNCTVLLVFHLR